jgi:hypothetical protein
MHRCRFLTTNKVGTFDEVFKSRIHISLYYKELNKDQTVQIWKKNLSRISETRSGIDFNKKGLVRWAKNEWKSGLEEAKSSNRKYRPWNGRQIYNACQTAAALAEFQNGGKLTVDHLNAVVQASREFDKYLQATHGTDDPGRAQQAGDRGDDVYANWARLTQGRNSPMPGLSPFPPIVGMWNQRPSTPTPQRGGAKKKTSSEKVATPEPEPESEEEKEEDGSDSSDDEE